MWITTSSDWRLVTIGVKAAIVAGNKARYKHDGKWQTGYAKRHGLKVFVLVEHRFTVDPGSWLQVWLPAIERAA